MTGGHRTNKPKLFREVCNVAFEKRLDLEVIALRSIIADFFCQSKHQLHIGLHHLHDFSATVVLSRHFFNGGNSQIILHGRERHLAAHHGQQRIELHVEFGQFGLVIPGGARRVVCLSSTYVAMLDAFGEVWRTVGVSGIDYITNEYVASHRDTIADLGAEMNYERLVAIRPDLVLLYGVDDAQAAVTDKLRELGIPYLYMGEYVEESPLGRAEWMVLLGEVTDRRAESAAVFQTIADSYNALRASVDTLKGRPTVMLNTPWQDIWYMPSVNSYTHRLISDAGGDYIYKENTSNGSIPVGLETAYRLLLKADVWLNVGMCASMDDLLALNPRFADAKAVRTGKVYNNNKRLTPGGGNDYWESAAVHPDVVLQDLIRILHPEQGGELFYYRKIE